MKEEGSKGKEKSKVILSIALAAIMLAFLAMMSTVSAQEPLPPGSYNGLYNNITLALNPPTVTPVLIGQNIWFVNSVAPVTIQGDPANDIIAGEIFTSDPQGKFDTSVMTKLGVYYVNPVISGTAVLSWEAKLAVTHSVMFLDLRVAGTSVSSIAEGTILQVHFTTNLDAKDMVSLVITDPDGVRLIATTTPLQHFDRINVNYLMNQYGVGAGINTSGWKLGTYTFYVQTEKNVTAGYGARGLEASSNEKTLSIIKSTINIEADKTSAVELASVKLTVTGKAGNIIQISTSDPAHTIFPGGSNDNPATDTYSGFLKIIDADGMRIFTVKFNATGSYTITVTDLTAVGQPTDTVDIAVSEKGVTFDVPSIVVIGEKLTIKGTANIGSFVTVAVEDTVYSTLDRLVLDANKEFSKEIDTTTAAGGSFSVPGWVRLKAFIDRPSGDTDTRDETGDGTTQVFMVGPWLTAELSTDSVDLDDDFTISGTARGSKSVDIVIVPPKGSRGTLIEAGATSIATGIYAASTSVSEIDYTFSKNITVATNADTGNYLVVVLSKGADNVYGELGAAYNLTAALAGYSLTAKTQEEVLEILEDATIGALGSDDLMRILTINVGVIETLTLNPIADVVVGNPLEVRGKTSRKDGSVIWITVKGRYYEIVPQAAIVKNNTFSATFDTTGAELGTYAVKAIDGYGYTAVASVSIIASEIKNQLPIASFIYSPENPVVNQTITFNASESYDSDGFITTHEFEFGDGTNETGEVLTHAYSSVGEYTVNLTVTDDEGATNRTSKVVKVFPKVPFFDTGSGTYPSICGTHNGTITPTHNINVSKIYTYPCAGTGGHTEYMKMWNNTGWNVTAMWNGYTGDWHNISFDKTFTLVANETYNYTIKTGSYPQIHHTDALLTANGWINCTEFIDANGKKYDDWIPAIRLE